MTGGKRIIAFETGAEAEHQHEATPYALGIRIPDSPADEGDAAFLPDDAEDGRPLRSGWLAPGLAVVSTLGWTAFYLWSQWPTMTGGVTPAEGAALFSGWTPPVALIALVWLLIMRNSRREAARFGDASRLLADESLRLEQRLSVVNRELSLAREFIAAQARDLESLGRIAAERLGENADRLQSLIRDNGAQVDAIAGVSVTALDNMERLRGQLPVIASSTKDLTNTIGHASQTAQQALAELRDGFARLGVAGEAGAAQVATVREQVDSSLGLFDSRLALIQQVVAARMETLDQRAAELAERLTTEEADALGRLSHRATVLQEEFDRTRSQLDSHEAEALTSLRARLAALRDEGAALARALRDGEAGALTALSEAKDRVEAEIAAVVERLDRLDREALEAATRRIEALSNEALEFDNRLVERNRAFTEETEHRLAQARERHDAEVERLAGLFRRLDADLAERLDRTQAHQRTAETVTAGITARIEALSERIAAIAAFGNQAESALGNSLAVLTERLANSREALSGTGNSIDTLTDGAVRLLELLQACGTQSRDVLSGSLDQGVGRLEEWEARVSALHTTVREVDGLGQALAGQVGDTRTAVQAVLGDLDRLQARVAVGSQAQAAAFAKLRDTLAEIGNHSEIVAEEASGRLSQAIAALADAARTTAAELEGNTSQAISALAEQLAEQSAAAVDRTLRARLADAIATLEQEASRAAGVSRDSTIQLRDQLARVSELTSNLEQRVAHARQRAEEQVDNDFARRVALITESLNSNAIDVAKALSTDVTDTAWAAYLKGDRGVFTRRALRLVEVAEQREVVRLYEEDMEFRSHVSRYIHDFEAMLRQLLSTRDGHALGVTLLSSDMGKLYVLLAQAIERLRT